MSGRGGAAPRAGMTVSAATRWYPSLAAVERDTVNAEVERIARGGAPNAAWDVCRPDRAPSAATERRAVGVERLFEAMHKLGGMRQVEVMTQLLEGSAAEAAIGVDSCGFNGQTALAVAAAGGHDEAIHLLLRFGADSNKANSRGWSPLMLAAQHGQLAAVQILLHASGIDIQQKNREGESSLTIALAAGHVDVAQTLVQAGARLPTMLGIGGSATAARERARKLAHEGLSKAANGGAPEVVRECLRVMEAKEWDRSEEGCPTSVLAGGDAAEASAKAKYLALTIDELRRRCEERFLGSGGSKSDLVGRLVDFEMPEEGWASPPKSLSPGAVPPPPPAVSSEAAEFAKTGEREFKYLWPGHRLQRGMERRREERRERGRALMREAEGKKRLLMSGMRVLLAPGHESAGNGALIPRDVGVVAKVAKDGSRVRVRGPSGRHCWYAHDELQSEQELSKQQEEEAERRRDAAARLQDDKGGGAIQGDAEEGEDGASSPVWWVKH